MNPEILGLVLFHEAVRLGVFGTVPFPPIFLNLASGVSRGRICKPFLYHVSRPCGCSDNAFYLYIFLAVAAN